MNCNECKNKIIEYIDGTLSENLDKEVEKHLSECKSCKEYYEEQLLIDKTFNEEFNLENVSFNSSKNKIMESIHKEKYSKGGIKIMKRKNNFARGIAIAAVFFLLGYFAPMATRYLGFGGNNDTTSMKASEASDNTKSNQTQMESVQEKADNAMPKVAEEVKNINREKVDNYDMEKVGIDTKLEFNSAWNTSPSQNLLATIEGKGNNAQEEGIGTIYIKDKDNGIMYKYTIKDNGKQSSPLSINWYDDENLIVVNGLGYGTLINGEEAQLINIKTGDEYLVYKVQGDNERIKSAIQEGNKIKITKAIYDEAMNNYKEQVDTID